MPLKHRGYGAYISRNGEEVEIHKAKVEKDRITMSGYIVSEAGMEFKVHWIESKPPSHLSVEVRMDGRRMGVVSHVKGSSKTSNGGIRVSVDALAPYKFSPLVTHDDDDLPSAYTEELGTIEVKLRRVRDFISVPFTPRMPPTGGSVHERKAKGRGTGSHCVSFGDKKDVKTKSTILKPLLIDDKPYVVFRFYYRQREYLESKGILRGRSSSRSSSATVVGSAASVSDHRKKKRQRTPSEAPSSTRSDSPAPPKRQRTVFEETEDMSTPTAVVDEDRPTPMTDEDEGDNKEDVVEVHLSSKNNYAIPGESASGVKVKREPSVQRGSSPRVKREPSPFPQKRPPKRVRREPSPPPARESSRSIKREPVPSPPPPTLPRPPRRRMPSPVAEREPSSAPRGLQTPPPRIPSVSVKRELTPSVLREPSPVVKREPSEDSAAALGPQPSDDDVKPEPQDNEEVTWDEEERRLSRFSLAPGAGT